MPSHPIFLCTYITSLASVGTLKRNNFYTLNPSYSKPKARVEDFASYLGQGETSVSQAKLLPVVLELQRLVAHLQAAPWLARHTLDGKLDLDALIREKKLDPMMHHVVRELRDAIALAYASVQYWAEVHLGEKNKAPQFLHQMGIRAQEEEREGEYSPYLVLSVPAGGLPSDTTFYRVCCGAVNR